MSNTQTLPTAKLWFKEGSSDKVYHVAIAAQGGGFVVNFAYGRRGSTLTTGTKTSAPVSEDAARKIFAKLVKEKTAKGYRPQAEPATIVQATIASGRMQVIPVGAPTVTMPPAPTYRAQLCNPIEDHELDGFVARVGNEWGAQEKYDGKRVLLVKKGKAVTGLNRHGKPTDVDPAIVEDALRYKSDFVLDGEAIGPDYYAFDLLAHAGEDFRALTVASRYNLLLKFVRRPNGWPIHCAPLVIGRKLIEKFIAELRAANKEGVVFKDLLAKYTPDRPNTAGPWRKFKFYTTCTAVVVAHNAKRSVLLGLCTQEVAGVWQGIEIGNCTIPPNQPVPPVGAVVEVRYLYYFDGGSLYQPVYLGVRDDIPMTDCTVTKQNLKRKGDTYAEDHNQAD